LRRFIYVYDFVNHWERVVTVEEFVVPVNSARSFIAAARKQSKAVA